MDYLEEKHDQFVAIKGLETLSIDQTLKALELFLNCSGSSPQERDIVELCTNKIHCALLREKENNENMLAVHKAMAIYQTK